MRAIGRVILVTTFCLLLFTNVLYSQNIYELRKYTDEDWVGMSIEERLKALNISNNHPGNQTFMGDFGRYTEES